MGVSRTMDGRRDALLHGPGVPWIIEPHYDTVLYWYVKRSR